jgi:hypothetical protein
MCIQESWGVVGEEIQDVSCREKIAFTDEFESQPNIDDDG